MEKGGLTRRQFMKATGALIMSEAVAACAPAPAKPIETAPTPTAAAKTSTPEVYVSTTPAANTVETPTPIDYDAEEKRLLPWGIYGREELNFAEEYSMRISKDLAMLAGIKTETDIEITFDPRLEKNHPTDLEHPTLDQELETELKAYMKNPNLNRIVHTSIPGLNAIEGHSGTVEGQDIKTMPDNYPQGWMPLQWMVKIPTEKLVGQTIEFVQHGKSVKMQFIAVNDVDEKIYEHIFSAGKPEEFKRYVREKGTDLMPIPTTHMSLADVFTDDQINAAELIMDTCSGKYIPWERGYNKVRFAALKVVEQK